MVTILSGCAVQPYPDKYDNIFNSDDRASGQYIKCPYAHAKNDWC